MSPPASRTSARKVSTLDIVPPVPTVSKLQKALLDLIWALCYEGLPCTRQAIYRDGIPILVPNEIPNRRFQCSSGVPTSFVLACTLHVRSGIQQKLWGVAYPDVGTDLRYFADRGWVNSYATTYRPMLGAFINPFDSQEVVSEIVSEPAAPPGHQIRWYVKYKGMLQSDARVGPDFVVPRVDFVKLTAAGHTAREYAVVSATRDRRKNRGPATDTSRGPGRPKGSRSQESALDHFITLEATLLRDHTHLPIKDLIRKFRKQTGITIRYEKMRSRIRTALGRR